MRVALLALATLLGCSGAHEAAVDAGAPDDAADAMATPDARPDLYRFTSAMDAHLEAGPYAPDGKVVPSTVCCDSDIGCFTSMYPGLGVCTDQVTGKNVDLGAEAVRFWFLHSSGGLSLSIQTEEPATGFTGACLLGPDGRLADHPQIPVVCFSPEGNVQYAAGEKTEVIGRASLLVQSDTPDTTGFDDYPYAADYQAHHYQVMTTCYPHATGAACPAGAGAVGANSCCDVGANMAFMLVNLVHGFVDLTSQ